MIGGFRSHLSITCMIDGNFGNVSAGVLFSKVAYQRKRCKILKTEDSKNCKKKLIFVKDQTNGIASYGSTVPSQPPADTT